MIPVFVPSYKRPEAIFLKRSLKYKFPLYVFIRKEEREDYAWIKERPDTTLVLLKNVKDIGETRKAMFNYAVKNGIEKVFMIDDDVSRLDISVWDEEKQIVRASGTVMGKPENWRKSLKLWGSLWENEALFGASYRPFSWSMKKHQLGKSSRAQLQQAVGVNVGLIHKEGLNYQGNSVVGNEDLFLQLECYQHGLECVRTSIIQYDSPAMGSGTGGCNSSESGTIQQKQEIRVKAFLKSCEDLSLVSVRQTRSGVKSIKFVWSRISEIMSEENNR